MNQKNQYKNQIRTVLLCILLGVGSYILGNILVLIIAQILTVTIGISIRNPAIQLGLSVIVLQGFTFGGFALIYLTLRRDLNFINIKLPSLKDLGYILAGTISLLILLALFSTIISILGIETASNVVISIGEENPTIFLVLIPLSFILIGPGEELLFRGLIQGLLRETFNKYRAISIASIIFAIIHVFSLQGPGKIVYIFVVFLLAIVLGISYEYTDNIIVPSIIHGAFNAIQFGAAYYIITQGIEMNLLVI